ncbi:MAG: beta-galactosidase [Candidatus Krumholzibacteriia bacterium]
MPRRYQTRNNLPGIAVLLGALPLLVGVLPLPAGAQNAGTGDSTPLQVVRLDWGVQTQVLETGLYLSDLIITPNPHLGLAFPGSHLEIYDAMTACGMGMARIDVNWSEREPAQDQFDWGGLDYKIRHLQGRGIDVFLTFATDAAWATLPSTLTATNRVPASMADWEDFVRTCVERYDGDGVGDLTGLERPVVHYQFINEWPSENNKAGGWCGDEAQLIATLNASYDAVKGAFPGAKVVLGGIPVGALDSMVLSAGIADYIARAAWTPTTTFTLDLQSAQDPAVIESVALRERVLAQTRYDVVDMHLYGPVQFNEYRINRLQPLIGSAGMISGECGGPNLAYDADISHEDHFLAALEMNLHALSRGVDFILWYMMLEREYVEGEATMTYGNSRLQLFDLNRQPKGGYWAYYLLASVLSDMETVTKVREGIFRIERADRPDVYVAWSMSDTQLLQLPDTIHPDMFMRVVDAQYGTFDVEVVPGNGVIELGPLPVIVSEELPAGNFGAQLQPHLDDVGHPILF